MKRMNIWLKAALFAAGIEGLLCVATFASSWAPCGPTTIFGMIGLLFHIFPGIFVGAGAESLGLPLSISWACGVVSQFLCWLLVLRIAFRRSENVSKRRSDSALQ
jgi:hypothetical protein